MDGGLGIAHAPPVHVALSIRCAFCKGCWQSARMVVQTRAQARKSCWQTSQPHSQKVHDPSQAKVEKELCLVDSSG
jgi:hypothetical protein